MKHRYAWKDRSRFLVYWFPNHLDCRNRFRLQHYIILVNLSCLCKSSQKFLLCKFDGQYFLKWMRMAAVADCWVLFLSNIFLLWMRRRYSDEKNKLIATKTKMQTSKSKNHISLLLLMGNKALRFLIDFWIDKSDAQCARLLENNAFDNCNTF